jgi:HK97 family phage portal protein
MAWLDSAVKAAANVVFGTGPWQAGQPSGTLAADVNVFDPVVAKSIIDGMTAGDLYETQPHLRTVVSFVARNGAQLGRHVYARGADDGRERVRGGVAELLAKPNDYMTGFDLFNMLFSELALYDMAIWVPVLRDGRWQIDPIPGEWITGSKGEDAFRRSGFYVKYPDKSQPTFVPAEDAIVFRGYSPSGFKHGSSAVRSLRSTLAEQVASMTFREQMWKRGGRVGMYMTRPKDAPVWSKEAKQKFIQNWRNNWSGSGANAGSTPLLEDGMELKRVGFTAKEEQWLEAATLSLATVAGAYHVPPSMVGVQGAAASFASVKEFRKMLYTETLGPLIAQVEETINTFLFPLVGAPRNQYLELNIAEKLQGDFEEQGNVLFQAVGGPYMTPNEARKRTNMPPIDGGDVLLAPLNMGAAGNNGPAADEPIGTEPSGAPESGQASAGAPKPQKATHGGHADGHKAPDPDDPVIAAMADDLKAFFGRQGRAVARAVNGKAPEWWDQKSWNQELSAILLPHLLTVSTGTARQVAGAKGLDPDAYSVAQTKAFLEAVSDSRADLINATTRDQLEAALQADDPVAAVKHVFEVAEEARAGEATMTIAAMLMAWATVEVAKQLVPDKGPTKTWVSSGKPNSRHAAMNGETVPIGEKFSNGADWPGDPVLGAAGVSNCACGVDINYNE